MWQALGKAMEGGGLGAQNLMEIQEAGGGPGGGGGQGGGEGGGGGGGRRDMP